MSLVTVLYGPAYDGKNDETFEKCLQKIRRREAQSCLYLVRSDVRARQLREQILQEDSGCFHFPVSTLPNFLKTFYRRMLGHKKLIGDLEQKILLENILYAQKATHGGDSYLSQFREHPGIVAKVLEFLAGVRRIGFSSAEELAPILRECRGRQQRVYEELLQLYTLYTQALGRTGKIDEAGIFLELAISAEAGQLDIALWTEKPELLVLEGYYELTRPVQQVFSALCAQFERTFITLDLPDNPYEFSDDLELPKAFRVYRHILPYIRQSGFSVRQYNAGFSSPSAAERPSEQILQRDPGQVAVQAYGNRKEEVTCIAREIRHLQQNGKIAALREVGVAFPVVEQYEHLIQEIFPRYGIPFSMFQGHSLASSPVAISIFRLFQALLEDCALDTLQALFASPLVQWSLSDAFSQERSDSPALALDSGSIHQLDALARRLEIREGRREWLEKLAEDRECHSPPGRGKGWVNTHGETDTLEPIPNPSLEGSLANSPLENALIPTLEDFFGFIGRFELKQRYQGEEFLDFMLEAIRRLHLPQRILQIEERSIREQESAALTTFLTLLDNFRQELRRHLSGQSRYTDFTPREFYDILRTLVAGERYYSPQHLEDSVYILGRLNTRQVRFRYFFFGGLIERDFPGQDDNYIFLSDQDAEQLGLPGYHEKLEESAHLFYLNSLNPSERIYLSYPMQDEEKDLLRSSYLEQLERQLREQEQVPAQAEAESPDSPQALYTFTELYEWLGRYWREHQPQNTASEDVERILAQLLPAKEGVRIGNFVEALRAQQGRNQAKLSAFDGILSANWSKMRLQRLYNPQQHVYSVSEFDLHARCPMKFFFQRLLGLAPLEDILPEMDALERGALLHKILFRFYSVAPGTDLGGQSGNVDRLFLQTRADREQWRIQARRRIAEIAEEELSAYHFSGVFWEQFRESLMSGLLSETASAEEAAEQKGLLAAFVETETSSEDKVSPCYLEAHFGMAKHSRYDGTAGESGYQLSAAPCELRGQTRDGLTATIRFQGKIDRIDLEDAGTPKKTPKAVLYDYKTGRVPSNTVLKEGRSFQLPLYLIAAREYLDDRAEAIAGGYYGLRTPEELAKKVSLGSKEHAGQKYFNTQQARSSVFASYGDVLSLLQRYADLAVQAAEEIREGRFHPTTLKQSDAGCIFCDYRQICRLEPQRMKQFREQATFQRRLKHE